MKLNSLIPNLIVEDVNKTVDYYQNTLGFAIVTTVPESGDLEFAMLKLDAVSIMFQSHKSYVDAFPESTGQKVGGTLFLFIDVEDLDGLYKKILEAKAEIAVDMHTTFYGTREFTIKDCDGYLLIFAENQS